MKQYEVVISRIAYASNIFHVTAKDKAEAKKLALEDAGNYSFREHDADYEIDSIQEVTTP